jgi:exosortase A
MWNPARPDSLAPPDGAGAAEFTDPMAARPGELPRLAQMGRLGPVVMIVLSLAWLLFWYRDTAFAMEAIWSRSGTFAHGYLVGPISIWLVWRKWEVLRTLALRSSIWGLLAGLGCGFAWLAAQLASVDSVAQFALVGILISAIWALAGTDVVRVLAFPLGFLFFSVPFGEFLFPDMMDLTANFVIGALRLSGVPVYVEGRSLVIPSGHWQVVEGCSGVRYLIASVVVGSLYGYLNYQSIWRRLAFTSISVVAPVLANWLRAYGVVMLGHISDNRLATGVDHIIYGWVFFGVVMLGLFWIGSRWREPEMPVAEEVAAARHGVRHKAPDFRAWTVVAMLMTVALSLASPALRWLEARGQHGPVLLGEPLAAAGWAPTDFAGLPEWAPRYGGMSAQTRSAWARDGAIVGVYVGYYRDQQPGRELINSENKIIKSKDPVWTMSSYGDRIAHLPEGPTLVRGIEIRGERGRLLVWHWYWIAGKVTSNDYVAKAWLLIAKLAGRGDDSAVVMLETPVAEDGRALAEQTLSAFARDMGPAIDHVLAAAAGQ